MTLSGPKNQSVLLRIAPTNKRLSADKTSEQYQLTYTTKEGEIFYLIL